jgi:RHS repeat-associated protein
MVTVSCRFEGSRRSVFVLWKARRQYLRLVPAVAALFLVGVFAHTAVAQSYLTSTGSPSFATPQPVELGFVDASNGNLHLSIPLGSYPQRGTSQPQAITLEYDSSIWSAQVPTFTAVWEISDQQPGWLLGGWYYSYQASGNRPSNQPVQGCWEDESWADQGGTTHTFHLNLNTVGGQGCPTSGDAFATDSSGYHMYYSPLVGTNVYAPDGTLAYSDTRDPNGRVIIAKDSNGNYMSSSNGCSYDTLGRRLTSDGASCDGVITTLSTSQGTAQYSTTYATINVNTHFQQSGVQETSTTIRVIRSITLPDAANSTYYFTYDCDSSSGNAACGSYSGQSAYYGVLTGITLPTGGRVNYNYTTFKDAYSNMSQWVSQRTSAGGTWTYTPKVLSNCGVTDVNCKQQTTVSTPTGEQTVYTYQLNNGAWPTSIVQKDASGNTMSTVTDTWNMIYACAPIGCYGNSFIQLSNQQTTVYTPSGSLTKKVSYTYDSKQTGNKTAIKEWRYSSSGSFSSVPDRATYISYLTTGTNNINRPLSVTLCNNSGSDSACPGGGTRVSQSLYSYDVYGASGLTSITGIAQHDDTNFGLGYTARGNVTSASQWVSGSSYLTTYFTYDTTGQVLMATDPAGNVTHYGYSDAFFTDGGNGTTPSAYTPSNPTNAYLTSVTDVIGIESMGYYWGSGKVGITTDYNSVSTYSHYQDGLDRQTEEIDPIGWKLATYSSATQSDMYTAVADTLPSTGCSSCQHTQAILDTWGRTASQILVNNPIGQINTDSGYDPEGRLHTQSHPYSGSGDPNHVFETFGYDVLGRQLSTTHPDGQAQRTAFGADVVELGGVTAQQGSTATYGYGYPQISVDEAGHQRQQWTDGFGRIIEADEPSTSTSAYAQTTVSISGGAQSQTVDPCQACRQYGCPPCPYTIGNSGNVNLVVGTYTASVYYSGNTASQMASDLANVFNTDPNSPVTASANGSSIMLTARGPGVSGNVTFTSSETWNSSNFTSADFVVSPASGALSGGSGGIGSSPYYTNYTYDVADHLTQVVQGVQTRTFQYDGLGRKIFENTPEGGTVTYSFTASGGGLCSGDPSNVCRRTDARGVVSIYTYDHVNRLTGVSYTIPSGQGIAAMSNVCTTAPNGTSANTCYYYDQGGSKVFAIGRMTKMMDPTGSESYSYDANGRATQLSKVINGQTYNLAYKYDASGDVTQITYPSGRVVYQAYNSIGQLCQISPTSSGCSGTGYYAGTFSYNAPGNLTNFSYGNGVAANFVYSAPRMQLSSLSYTFGSQTYFNIGYWYQQNSSSCPNGAASNNGTVQCITDGKDGGRTVNYGYDSLLRLKSAKTNGSTGFPQWGLSETYDRYGNRLSQAVTAGSGPSSSLSFGSKNQPTGYAFDVSGNMTVEPLSPQNNMTYDGENRMAAFSGIGGAATYTYDGNGLRVIKSAQGGTTTVSFFAGSSVIAEYDNGAAPGSPSREYISGPSGLLAMISAGATTYYHQDHLSARLTTDANGNILSQEGHFPFGEQWYQSGAGNKWSFTSYQRDSESGLDYALARYYDSRTGTFCSADPLAGSPGDPQSWNRYPYGRNDPIDITDPSGKSWWSSLLIDAGIAVASYFLPALAPELFDATAATETMSVEQTASTLLSESGSVMSYSAGINATLTATSASLTPAFFGGAVGAELTTPQNPPQTPTAPQTPKKNCPPVPSHPKGVNINSNISAMENVNAADPTKGKVGAWGWFINKVQTNGAWDYKTQGITYDDFGNFNYGATGAVLTNSFQTLTQGAVMARLAKTPLTQLKKYGLGNDPHKNEMIRQGMQYKQNGCGSV